jgi:hypothetical protein
VDAKDELVGGAAFSSWKSISFSGSLVVAKIKISIPLDILQLDFNRPLLTR